MDDKQWCEVDAESDASIAHVDAWLRRHLGRQLTLAMAVPEPVIHDAARQLVDELTRYREIRMLVQPASSELGAFLDSLVQTEPEVILVWTTPSGAEEAPAELAQHAVGSMPQLLDELEARGLLDRAFVALVGVGVTRQAARRLGFEDGYSFDAVPAELAATLAREAVAVDERRRRGSSPPCYL